MAEVHASAIEDDNDILVVQASEQRAVCSTDPGRAPRVGSVPTSGEFVSEPLEHLVQRVDLDGRPTEGVVVLEPLEHSFLDVSLDSRPMAGKLDLELLENSVSEEDQTGGHMEGEFSPEPLEHSVVDMHLDSQPRHDVLDSGPLEHSVPGRAPSGGAVLYEKLTVSDPLEHSGLRTSDDSVSQPAPSEPLEHSVPTGPQLCGDGVTPKVDTTVHLQSACIPKVISESQRVDDPVLEDRPETAGSRSEAGEAIVVGAIGSPAPWFLTGWTHEVEIEFMIDTGCQVTILSETVFERLCPLDPKVRS